MNQNRIFKLLFVLLLISYINIQTEALTSPKVSWYYRANIASNGTVVTLNTGDTFVATCSGYAIDSWSNGNRPIFFILTKGSPTSSATITASSGGTGGATLTNISPTPIYDSLNGSYGNYDHIVVMVNINGHAGSSVGRGLLTMYIPYIQAGDAGKYYCAFDCSSDGTTPSTVTFNSATGTGSVSGSIELVVLTKSSASKNYKNSKFIGYSIMILNAYKFIF